MFRTPLHRIRVSVGLMATIQIKHEINYMLIYLRELQIKDYINEHSNASRETISSLYKESMDYERRLKKHLPSTKITQLLPKSKRPSY